MQRGVLLYSTKENLVEEAPVSDDCPWSTTGAYGEEADTATSAWASELTLVDWTFEVPDDFDLHSYLARQLHTHHRVSTRLRLALGDRAVAASYEQVRQEGKGD